MVSPFSPSILPDGDWWRRATVSTILNDCKTFRAARLIDVEFASFPTLGNARKVAVAVLLGLAAYGGKKRGFEPMPALMGFLLGHMLEDHLRRMLMITRGNLTTIVERPISGVALFIALLVLAGAFWGWLRQPKGAAPS
ncbi:MAG: hypothetical protein ABL893_15760 [Hyphomicrobium sp.]